ncbi:MAG: acetate--CoA ligase family protein [Prolixibacteraceae bacterium]|jgi:acyl-CoA synthetase (NDP forming)|nr:acetate--CoA ligase family protein [Prolixibacteraceae bacterium]
MINEQLFYPESIVVVGASNNIEKPGGKLLKNLIDTNFRGRLVAVNPRDKQVQRVETYADVMDVPCVDLAILAIPAHICPQIMRVLAEQKCVKAFIVISAGFSEESETGGELEKQLVDIANNNKACLIGPNCIGVLAPYHASVFTTPVPGLSRSGVDFISGSGATAVFIMESAIPKGLRFHSVVSVGNSAQHGIEDVLAYMDETFDHDESSKIKLLYIENISNPDRLLYHAKSLIRKGCRIAAIKAGSSEAGSRAASSHTGALASSDLAVEALFRKAGIVRCYGREELTTVACIFSTKMLEGNNIAIITHAGGPAVMLTDALESGGLKIPRISDSPKKQALKNALLSGSSVENPIDFLATGNAEHLEAVIDACENDFDEIDAMAVIYGSPGLFPVREVYNTLDKKMKTCTKPIYPILPSVVNVKDDVSYFISHGNVNFPDEVLLGKALTKVFNTPPPSGKPEFLNEVNVERVRELVSKAPVGFQSPEVVGQILDLAGIERAKERIVKTKDEAMKAASEIGFPMVMKVIGPLHKTDVDGVSLNIKSIETVEKEFSRLINIEETTAVLMAEMHAGTELFIGAKYEDNFGHVMLCGLGGIFVEVLGEVTSGLAPLSMREAVSMIKNLRARKILEGFRGTPAVDIDTFARQLVKLSGLLRFATEIKELDINPLLAKGNSIVAVDARIRIEHDKKQRSSYSHLC